MNRENFILATDAYKTTHWKQLPADVTHCSAYLESRGGEFSKTLQIGIMPKIEEYFAGEVLTKDMIGEAEEELGCVFGTKDHFNKKGWNRLLEKHEGRLPISIQMIPEGVWVPKNNVLVQVTNTDEEFPWLPNFCESSLLHVWHPISVGTLSGNIRALIKRYADRSSDTGVSPFHLNDFGYRSSTCLTAARSAGMAHLANFQGTDTLVANKLIRDSYNGPRGYGKSVFATEHFTTTIWSREKECEAYREFLTRCPEGIASLVIDSYDPFEAVKMLGTTLKELVLSRGSATGFAKTVVRPDSGDPVTVSVQIIRLLDLYFGSTINSKGFKVLHPKVGAIYGDGINYKSIDAILEAVTVAGYSTDCIVFGAGSALVNEVVRDTHKFAFKCSAARRRDGVWFDVYKDPSTDRGKRSKRGVLKSVKDSFGDYQTIRQDADDNRPDELVEVFRDGAILRRFKWEDVVQSAIDTF